MEEAAVLNAISSAKGRGKSGLTLEQLDAFDAAVTALEQDGGVQVVINSLKPIEVLYASILQHNSLAFLATEVGALRRSLGRPRRPPARSIKCYLHTYSHTSLFCSQYLPQDEVASICSHMVPMIAPKSCCSLYAMADSI